MRSLSVTLMMATLLASTAAFGQTAAGDHPAKPHSHHKAVAAAPAADDEVLPVPPVAPAVAQWFSKAVDNILTGPDLDEDGKR